MLFKVNQINSLRIRFENPFGYPPVLVLVRFKLNLINMISTRVQSFKNCFADSFVSIDVSKGSSQGYSVQWPCSRLIRRRVRIMKLACYTNPRHWIYNTETCTLSFFFYKKNISSVISDFSILRIPICNLNTAIIKIPNSKQNRKIWIKKKEKSFKIRANINECFICCPILIWFQFGPSYTLRQLSIHGPVLAFRTHLIEGIVN